MGNKASVPSEVKGHPEFFYQGVEEVKVGRYQDAELYFHQALRQHEGRAFWTDLLNGYWRKTPQTGERERPHKTTHVATAAEAEGTDAANVEGKSQHTQQLSSHHSSSVGMKYIDLPLDASLLPIMDYLRLMSDIMNAYLCRDLDDKNVSLALVHCCYLGIHTQLIFFLIMLWNADNAELLEKIKDGNMFVVDSNQREECMTEPMNGNYHNNNALNDDNSREGAAVNGNANILVSGQQNHDVGEKNNANNFSSKLLNWKVSSRDEIPTGTDILLIRNTVLAFIRHHWLAVVFNYCSISLLYVEKRCLPTETKKIDHIFHNILEASSSSIWDLRNAFEAEGEKNVLAMNLLKRMPKHIDYNFDVDAVKKDAASAGSGSNGNGSGANHSEASKTYSQFFFSLTGGKNVAGTTAAVNTAMQTFLSLSTTFSPTYPLMLDTRVTLPIRLNVRVDTPRSKICTNKLRSPGNYNLFHYTNWFAPQDVFMVAGYNSNFLNKMLPYYSTPAAGEESSFISKVRVSGNQSKTGAATTFIKRDRNFIVEQMNSTETENYVDPALRQLMTNDLVKNQHIVQRIKTQKSYYNPLLKHNDPYTLNAIIFEEDVVHAVYPILMQIKVLNRMGRQDEAEGWTVSLLRMADEFYGRESQEYSYLNRAVDVYK